VQIVVSAKTDVFKLKNLSRV